MGNVTIGSATYKVYDTYENAVEYLQASLSASDWKQGSADVKKSALVMVTRLFETMNWKGIKTGVSQELQWPRDQTGVSVDGVTPEDLLHGFWEYAALVAANPDVLNNRSDTGNGNVQRLRTDDTEVTFFRPHGSDLFFPMQVWRLIGKYLEVGHPILSEALGVNVDYISEFDFESRRERLGGLY